MEKWLFSKTCKKELHKMFTPRVQYGMNLGCRPSNGQMNEPKGRVLFFAHVVLETGAEVANLARAGNAHEDTGAGQRLQEESLKQRPQHCFLSSLPRAQSSSPRDTSSRTQCRVPWQRDCLFPVGTPDEAG